MTDSGGGIGNAVTVVTVLDVAPVVTIESVTSPIDEDGVTSLSGNFTDVCHLDTHSAVIDWDDGTIEPLTIVQDSESGTFTASHQYLDDDPSVTPSDTYIVTVTVTDDDTVSGTDTAPVTVNNLDPTVEAGTDQTVNEGDTVSLDPASYSDTGTQDTHTASIEWGDGTAPDEGAVSGGIVPGSHTYVDNGLNTATITVTDDDTGTGTDSLLVTVNNVAPTVSAIEAPVDAVPVNTTIDTSADFTDPGILDTHTAVWDWGDGSTSNGVVNESNGNGRVTGSHNYNAPGIYTVTVTVTDKDGDSDQSVFQYVIVYEITDKFVTGGPTIRSPIGAYPNDPSLKGKANCGFNIKYDENFNTPYGELEFQFKAADLNFHNSSYEWLVISGPKAVFKGSGTINGAGDYAFITVAIDGDADGGDGIDKFRIVIWDKNTEEIIYDNMPGEPIGGNAASELTGGGISIHKD